MRRFAAPDFSFRRRYATTRLGPGTMREDATEIEPYDERKSILLVFHIEGIANREGDA